MGILSSEKTYCRCLDDHVQYIKVCHSHSTIIFLQFILHSTPAMNSRAYWRISARSLRLNCEDASLTAIPRILNDSRMLGINVVYSQSSGGKYGAAQLAAAVVYVFTPKQPIMEYQPQVFGIQQVAKLKARVSSLIPLLSCFKYSFGQFDLR